MKKNVYSLVLMEDVVEAIDQLAYSLNMSRSNLINQILAERVTLVTPEQHLQRVFNTLSENLKPYSYFQVQNQAADHMYSVKSALRYKYNPTIRYCIYLTHDPTCLTGQLKVISRTQSELLLYNLDAFFTLWEQIEQELQNTSWTREDGSKWLRSLNIENLQSCAQDNELATALSHYIKGLDDGLKLYFKLLDNQTLHYTLLKEHYLNHYRDMKYPL